MASFIELLGKTISARDDVVDLGDGAYGIQGIGFVALAWNPEDAQAILRGEIPSDVRYVEVDGAMPLPTKMQREAAASSMKDVARQFDGRPVIIREAQWGGHGGMPPGGGYGVGGGFGESAPMGTTNNFQNFIARQFFDTSLDASRTRGPIENGWFRSLENRLQDEGDHLYSHRRNDQDHNLEPYELTWEDRVKVKKQRYLDRVRERRRNPENPEDQGENSVAAIKAMPKNPDNYDSAERKLKSRRQSDDGKNFRPDYHGPESQFVHHPSPPLRREAQIHTSRGKGFTAFDDTKTHERMMNEILNPSLGPTRALPRPQATSVAGTEAGLDGMRGSSPDRWQTPNRTYWQNDPKIALGGEHRMREFPYSMRGPQMDNIADMNGPQMQSRLMGWGDDLRHLREVYRHGNPEEYNIPLVMEHWPEYRNPSDPPSILTEEEQKGIIDLMRKRFFEDESIPNPRGTDADETSVEERLKQKRRPYQTGTPGRAAFEWNKEPYPWSNRDMIVPSTGRASRSRGY